MTSFKRDKEQDRRILRAIMLALDAFLGGQTETTSSNTLRRWGVQTGKGTCESHYSFLH